MNLFYYYYLMQSLFLLESHLNKTELPILRIIINIYYRRLKSMSVKLTSQKPSVIHQPMRKQKHEKDLGETSIKDFNVAFH